MLLKFTLLALSIGAFVVAGCGAGVPAATQTAVPTKTATPTPTPQPTSTLSTSALPAPASFPTPSLGTITRDVTYCTAGGRPLGLDLYFPPPSSAPSPAVVYVHGGGWTGGDKEDSVMTLGLQALAAEGYLVAAVNYRLAPQYSFPAQIEDVKCAVRFLRAHAGQYGLDPNHIGAWGASAGGHLVALLGLAGPAAGFDVGQYADQSSRVQAVVDMFGPADFTVNNLSPAEIAQYTAQLRGFLTPADAQRASPVTYVSPGAPPFLIMHGDKDALVPLGQSQELYDRLKAAGVPATLVVVKNAGHGLTSVGGPISPSLLDLMQTTLDFFDRYLR